MPCTRRGDAKERKATFHLGAAASRSFGESRKADEEGSAPSCPTDMDVELYRNWRSQDEAKS